MIIAPAKYYTSKDITWIMVNENCFSKWVTDLCYQGTIQVIRKEMCKNPESYPQIIDDNIPQSAIASRKNAKLKTALA